MTLRVATHVLFLSFRGMERDQVAAIVLNAKQRTSLFWTPSLNFVQLPEVLKSFKARHLYMYRKSL